jgi:prevent-host-death family protein
MAELKANLRSFLRRVRRGESVTVCDRDTPVARLVPIEDKGGIQRAELGFFQSADDQRTAADR